MKTFTYRGFTVDIKPFEEGYLYFANNGCHEISDPNPWYRDGLYLTEEAAEDAAKEHIYLHVINSMFVQLTAAEQAFVTEVMTLVQNDGISSALKFLQPSLSTED